MAGGVRSRTRGEDDPLYLQVARTLRAEIVEGTHPVGAQLPTEDELGARFSVSRYTVREALRRLRDDGLIASRQGAGTTVVPPRAAEPHVLHAMSIGDLVAFATGTRLTIDTVRMATIGMRLAQRIGVTAGAEWLTIRGFRRTDGADAPLCLADYYVNRRFASVARLLPRHDGPIFPLIEDLFAVRIADVEQEIGATVIGAAAADALKVERGSIALEVRRTYRLEDGEVAQVTLNTHPAARFRHSMTMKRVRP